MVERYWRILGRKYMYHAKEQDKWKGFVMGFVHTNLRSVDGDRRVIDKLLSDIPSPEEAWCPLEYSEYRPYRLSRAHLVSICENANTFRRVEPAIRYCDRERMREFKLKGVDVKHLGYKGIDMTLLDCGCELPVVDIHLARYLFKKRPEFRRLFERFGITNPYSKEFRRRFRIMQVSRRSYDEMWRIAMDEAAAEGMPPGQWHVAAWMKERFYRVFPKLKDYRRYRVARIYVSRLFKKS